MNWKGSRRKRLWLILRYFLEFAWVDEYYENFHSAKPACGPIVEPENIRIRKRALLL
jgi:hypothetical protein